jgi:hypothetical protein
VVFKNLSIRLVFATSTQSPLSDSIEMDFSESRNQSEEIVSLQKMWFTPVILASWEAEIGRIAV